MTTKGSPAFSLALALLVGSCGVDSEPAGPSTSDSERIEDADSVAVPRLRWVGVIEETDVRVALLVGTGKARLYFCGGAESYATATRWFNEGYDGGEHMDFERDTWRVHVHLSHGAVAGEVELGDGVTRSVRAELVDPATLAGLYEGTAECGRVGLIVTQATKDALPTAQGACTNTTGEPAQQVNPITPISSEAGKLRVRTPDGGDATLLVQAATLEPL